MKKSQTIGQIDEDGAWLTRSAAASAMGISAYKFAKEFAR